MSLSREFAAFVADLNFDDLPREVVDRAKGVTLQALTSALVAHDMPGSKQALALMQEEEAGGGGIATVLCNGSKLTKAGAAFVNTETIFAGGKWDTFRMLTHPGTAILPAALVAAETTGVSGKAFLVAVAAGYEVMERMAAEFITTVMSRGFHAGPVFGIFGAAIAAAKLGGLDQNQIHGAVAQCVNLAAGNLEGARSGGRSLREGGAVRNALLAVALAKHGTPGGETTLEGEAGFYHAYAGNNRGELRYSFTGSTQYFTAWGAVERGYPLLRGAGPGPGETDPPQVLDLMHRVSLIPTIRRTLFGPRITVFTKDGRSFTREGTGREFIWDFEEEVRRIRPVTPGLAVSEAQFAELIDTCRHLEGIDRAAQKLIALTIPS